MGTESEDRGGIDGEDKGRKDDEDRGRTDDEDIRNPDGKDGACINDKDDTHVQDNNGQTIDISSPYNKFRAPKKPLSDRGAKNKIYLTLSHHVKDPMTLDQALEDIEGTLEGETTKKHALRMVRSMHEPKCFKELQTSMRQHLAVLPEPKDGPHPVPQEAPDSLRLLVRTFSTIHNDAAKKADKTQLLHTFVEVEARYHWEELKEVFDNPERQGHDWLMNEVALLRKKMNNARGRKHHDLLKICVAPYFGYDCRDNKSERGRKDSHAFDHVMDRASVAGAAISVSGVGVLALIPRHWYELYRTHDVLY